MTTKTEARDAMVSTLRTAWLADVTSAPIELQFDNVKMDPPATVDGEGRPVSFSRISVRHTSGEQSSLGAIGNRRFLSTGVLTQQIFTAPGDGHELGDQLVAIVEAAMKTMRSSKSVWLTGVRAPEIGISGAWMQVNVEADFAYQEVS